MAKQPLIERAQVRHQQAANDVGKLALKRDQALDALIRAETRYRKAVKTVGRTQKRYDRLREEARAVRATKEERRKAEKTRPAEIGEDIVEAMQLDKPKHRRKAPPGSEAAALLHEPPSARKPKAKSQFEVGNQVHISDGPDRVFYEITRLLPGGGCFIRQEGKVNGKHYAEQRSDVSLLRHAVTDEMLEAFSIGGLKAGRKTTLSV